MIDGSAGYQLQSRDKILMIGFGVKRLKCRYKQLIGVLLESIRPKDALELTTLSQPVRVVLMLNNVLAEVRNHIAGLLEDRMLIVLPSRGAVNSCLEEGLARGFVAKPFPDTSRVKREPKARKSAQPPRSRGRAPKPVAPPKPWPEQTLMAFIRQIVPPETLATGLSDQAVAALTQQAKDRGFRTNIWTVHRVLLNNGPAFSP